MYDIYCIVLTVYIEHVRSKYVFLLLIFYLNQIMNVICTFGKYKFP